MFSSAQDLPIDKETGKITYSGVVTVENADASQLFSRAQAYFVNTFVDSKSVIQMKDESSKTIIGKGNISMPERLWKTGWVNFTLTIQAKDGRYRYVVTDFSHDNSLSSSIGGALENEKPACGTFNMMMKHWNLYKEHTNSRVTLLIASLKKAMDVPSSKTDW